MASSSSRHALDEAAGTLEVTSGKGMEQMTLQVPFIVALIVMALLLLVFFAWTFGPATRSHRWQDRGRSA